MRVNKANTQMIILQSREAQQWRVGQWGEKAMSFRARTFIYQWQGTA
jgi:hypothetical protein